MNYEDYAIQYLQQKGCRILTRNFRSRFGEIDIIAQDKEFTVFVEVKARKAHSKISGFESVDKYKQQRICKTAQWYRAQNGQTYYRFDVLQIIFAQHWRQYQWIKNAFEFIS